MDYVWVVHGNEFAENCKKSMDSVQRVDPDAKCVVYTDKVYPVIAEYCKEVGAYHGHPFMLMNVLCQFAHLVNTKRGGSVLFLDADAILVESMPPWDEDLMVTWREGLGNLSNLMPYNYGVLGARSTVHSIAAWSWMATHITKQTPRAQDWGANQVALRELVGTPTKDSEPVRVEKEWFDFDVIHRPCDIYNWTPEEIDLPIDGKVAVHLKGGRKDLIDHYYKRVMAQ